MKTVISHERKMVTLTAAMVKRVVDNSVLRLEREAYERRLDLYRRVYAYQAEVYNEVPSWN